MSEAEANLATMDRASDFFNVVVTPLLRPSVMAMPPDLRQAWWDGFLSSLVGAMAATIGERATQECCDDLYTRAKDFANDQRKANKG
jgi:hypothetical protein